ncbi:tetratricopeptide repeat protein [Roseivirga sp.]|uniref:tetratricopeptide repeat protein n=1 Tax=Roseivirga sp. TaxID=1964215 RepID=UPI003B8E767C
MKGCITIIVLFFLAHNSVAQINVESLDIEIEKRSDTVQVIQLYQTAIKMFNRDPALSEQYASRALILAKELEYIEGQVEALTVLGALHNIKFQLEQGREKLGEALALAKQASYKEGIAQVNYSLGSNYMKSGFYDLAIECFIEGLEEARLSKNHNLEMSNLLDLGIAKSAIGQYDEAEMYLREGIQSIKSRNPSFNSIHFTGSLGNLEFARGNFANAEKYHLEALGYIKEAGDRKLQIHSWSQLGQIYSKLYQEKRALQYLDSAQNLSLELGLTLSSVSIMRTKARVYLDYGRNDEGLTLLNKIMLMRDVYRESIGLKMDLYDLSVEFNERLGLYKEAFIAQKALSNLRDSLFSEERFDRITEINAKYEFDQLKTKAEAEEQLNKINKLKITQKNLLILVLSIVFLVSILVFLWNKKRLEHRLLLTQKEQALLEKESKLKNYEIEDQGRRIVDYKEKLEKAEELASQGAQENRLVDFLKSSSMHAVDWVAFRIAFDEKFPSFFNALDSHQLTVNEERLCCLIKLGLVTREIADLLAISPNSVIKAKSRLNKKIGLTHKQHLDTYLKEVDLALKQA